MADEKPILRFEHAYTPNEQASYGGGDHMVLDRDFERARLRRKKDDALCKPRGKFWGLHETDACPVVWDALEQASAPSASESQIAQARGILDRNICRKCREMAERHQIPFPHRPPKL